MSAARRDAQEILEDPAEAIDAAAELVALGKHRWDSERPLRLAGEAVVGRLGDIATKLPASTSSVSQARSTFRTRERSPSRSGGAVVTCSAVPSSDTTWASQAVSR